ncbi:alpha/beta hydrolase [Candidatus Roizmanbacteria bacterium]|nr:alpha/beta hydrolase [Candidatus Roizmanbacteria bacterium]
MKNFFIITILFFLFVIPVKAFEFAKDSHNPLNISYINNYSKQLQAHIFKKDNLYQGVLTVRKDSEGYFSLVLIKSNDGFNWVMDKEILNLGVELSNARYSKTVDGKNKLFVTKQDSDTKYRLYSTECDDSFNCDHNLMPVLNIDQNDITEQNGMFAGFPYQQNSRTYLFYGAWGIDGFKIRLAYSDDWQNWIKCPNKNNLVFGGDGPFVYQIENNLYLFYHESDSTGLKLGKTSLPLTCDSQFEDQGYILTKTASYDNRHIIFPSLLEENYSLFLYYSGLGTDSIWRLNLAEAGLINPSPTIIPTPTLTPTLIPTLTLIPTPTVIQPKTPIIIIPGFMASWNRQAILFNQYVPQSEWNTPSFIKEYDGLIKSLKNIGYEINKDLFIFNYDWRKPVTDIADDLNNFLTNNPSTSLRTAQFSIVGHSLGGLVGRIYEQKYQNNNLSKLITVGSPHQGVTQTYKVVEAGEIDRSNSYFWMAVKTVLNLHRNKLETDREIINRLFPVLKDIFPVYNFLKKDGVEIDIASMNVRNELLSNETHESNLISIVGEKGPTLKGFNVEEPSLADRLLGNYPDGRPTSSFNDIGDYLVLSSSAALNTPSVLSLDHGEIIYRKEAIKKILELLNIDYSDSQIIEGKSTRFDRSLIIFIKSKGKMEMKFNNQKYDSKDGVIIISDAKRGDYELKVKGSKKEKDEIVIWKINENSDSWEELGRETSPGRINYYNIHY